MRTQTRSKLCASAHRAPDQAPCKLTGEHADTARGGLEWTFGWGTTVTCRGGRPHAFQVCTVLFDEGRQRPDRAPAFAAGRGPRRTWLNETATECHEAGGLPPGARLLVLGRQNVSEGGRLSWCTSGWT